MGTLDRGALPKRGPTARCGMCRGVVDVEGRREAKREGWRYLDNLGWLCPVCALGRSFAAPESSGVPVVRGTVPNGPRARARGVRSMCATCANEKAAAVPRDKAQAKGFGWKWTRALGWVCGQCAADRARKVKETKREANRAVRGFGLRGLGDVLPGDHTR